MSFTIDSALDAIKTKLLERFDSVPSLPESKGVWVHFKAPDGTDAILTVLQVKERLRIEFTRNLTDNITEQPSPDEKTIFLRMNSDTLIKVRDDPAIPVMYGHFSLKHEDLSLIHI